MNGDAASLSDPQKSHRKASATPLFPALWATGTTTSAHLTIHNLEDGLLQLVLGQTNKCRAIKDERGTNESFETTDTRV